MKLTLKTIINAKSSIETLSNIEFTASISFKLGKAIKLINAEIEEYNKTRNDLLVKLGIPSEDSKSFTFTQENGIKFFKEEKELQNTEVELNIIAFPLSILDGKEIKPSDAVNLEFLFEAE